jgi:4-amino-4-deoxy-L-arabinose transferase-like glycosyltransferase
MWGLAAVVVAISLLYSLLPLGTALQFGGDEGYQLMTSFLMSKGFVLYKEIWSDQPPLFVLLLDWAFKLFGPSILAARLVAAGFGLLLFATLYQVVKGFLGPWQALLAMFFLLASPGLLELSISVMQEVPTFSVALVSVLLLFQWRTRQHWIWLLASGIAMGLALGIKLTAILVIPAMLVEMLLEFKQKYSLDWIKIVSFSVLRWSAAAAITFALIALVWGRGSFQSSYRAHFAENSVHGMDRPEDFTPPIDVFLDHSEGVLAAIAGIIIIVRRRRVREFAFPCVWMVTTSAVHAVHRPWWMYYYLHLAIPMAWLAGFAVSEIIESFCSILTKTAWKLSSAELWKALALCALAALALVRSEGRVEAGVNNLQQRMRVNADPIVLKMKAYGGSTHWVYVRFSKEVYAFHARLPMPPELAMVTLKRFWSGQISTEQILDTCRRYKPDQVLLDPSEVTSQWKGFLTNYSIVYQDKWNVLYGIEANHTPHLQEVKIPGGGLK